MNYFLKEKIFNNAGNYWEMIYCTNKCRFCSYYPRCRRTGDSFYWRLYEIIYKR